MPSHISGENVKGGDWLHCLSLMLSLDLLRPPKVDVHRRIMSCILASTWPIHPEFHRVLDLWCERCAQGRMMGSEKRSCGLPILPREIKELCDEMLLSMDYESTRTGVEAEVAGCNKPVMIGQESTSAYDSLMQRYGLNGSDNAITIEMAFDGTDASLKRLLNCNKVLHGIVATYCALKYMSTCIDRYNMHPTVIPFVCDPRELPLRHVLLLLNHEAKLERNDPLVKNRKFTSDLFGSLLEVSKVRCQELFSRENMIVLHHRHALKEDASIVFSAAVSLAHNIMTDCLWSDTIILRSLFRQLSCSQTTNIVFNYLLEPFFTNIKLHDTTSTDLQQQLWSLWLASHALSPTPQQLELETIRLFYRQSGSSMYIGSYAALAREPLLIFRLPRCMLQNALVLRITVFVGVSLTDAAAGAARDVALTKGWRNIAPLSIRSQDSSALSENWNKTASGLLDQLHRALYVRVCNELCKVISKDAGDGIMIDTDTANIESLLLKAGEATVSSNAEDESKDVLPSPILTILLGNGVGADDLDSHTMIRNASDMCCFYTDISSKLVLGIADVIGPTYNATHLQFAKSVMQLSRVSIESASHAEELYNSAHSAVPARHSESKGRGCVCWRCLHSPKSFQNINASELQDQLSNYYGVGAAQKKRIRPSDAQEQRKSIKIKQSSKKSKHASI